MWFFGRKKRSQEEEYAKLALLNKHGATCETCKNRKKCDSYYNEDDVCVSYKGVTEKGVEFF